VTSSSEGSAQYFEASPRVASREASVTLALVDVTLTLATDRGVFSHGGVDAGTRYLLQEAAGPPPSCATALDLGCGYGPIACVLARRAPGARVWAVDVNERARALCASNAAANHLANVVVAAPDEVPDGVRFDLIWSNPPIRIGKEALHELLARWLARLHPTGRAVLVVQKHLGADSLAAWLRAQGYTVVRAGSRQGYRLLVVTPPAEGS
jgi:16S rRNA (guanine1207-N2)-methyltransferase